jgi:Flp pilus assembly pilin Flp
MRGDSAAPLDPSPPWRNGTFEAGITFVEILAAQREARRVVDGTTAGQGAESWCEGSSDPESHTWVAPTDGDLPECETSNEAECVEARRRLKPRIIGQGMVEYAAVVVLVAVAVILLVGAVGHQAQDVFSNLSRGLAT